MIVKRFFYACNAISQQNNATAAATKQSNILIHSHGIS
jgi:hypothetical protein